MALPRRVFLTQLASAPLLYGWRELWGASDESPEWYRQALRRMKETGRHGIVLLAPEEDLHADRSLPAVREAARRRFGQALWVLANEDHPAAQELFVEAVFIGMTPESAGREFPAEGDGNNRILLDPEGKVISADAVPVTTLEDPERFVSSFRLLLHGDGNQRLRERAKAIELTLPDDVRRAFPRLSSDSAEEREEAKALLAKHADRMAPYLVHVELTGRTVEERGRASDILRSLFLASKENTVGPRLPYGCILPEFEACCGHLVPKEEANFECGLGRAPKKSRKFLRFLLK